MAVAHHQAATPFVTFVRQLGEVGVDLGLQRGGQHPPRALPHNNDDLYGRESRFEPYSATVVMAGLSLVTVVTRDEDSPFSQNIRSLLQRALISQVRRN
ncbi:hypothetical protein GCM10022255_101010 [Dactylosporangium darangshiense]|uniref:Uncharacterized protein n=1 Tax=Dactylosporangium darangshiense TaxID=579108 RepID=A0ABP8DS22_9ACTN